MRFRERKCLEALLDPLVNVREPLFETQHLFTHDLESKVSRLDDAGVNRTDCDLVDAIAAHTDKRVILFTRLPFGRWLEVAPQGKHVDRPCRLPYPRALIVGIALQAQQVEHGALHPVGGGKDRR